MKTCVECGRESGGDARFCAGCGAPLETPPAAIARKERKIVTVLFADLVGSTARAERLDPEDVSAMLATYHHRVRGELERFGGTVEKFIGDAVVALFGAPIAHEDDPERAVRAALAVRDAVAELNAEDADLDLHVRVAVNTGEALVSLDARPSSGEGMAAGDVMNTAARLQAAAPVNGILVGEQTFRATERVFEYAPADPVVARGKADPIAVWEPVAPKARLGVDVEQGGNSELVGRDRELELLVGAFERTKAGREPQLLTLVGVPGIGKSRLVYELSRAVDAQPELTYWRQGRCLPYGEGVAFWALSEMVKAQAGVLETDDPGATERKLRDALERLGLGERVARELRPLVGLAAASEVSGESRTEAFAAWRELLEGLAEERPLVLVFEDLHWADDGLLDFIDYLADWVRDAPLLCVCTARPELIERRPGWGGGKLNASTVALAPLSDEQTSLLLHGLLDRAVMAADTQTELLARAGGNPLYAEEYARMLADRVNGGDVLPETVQGIIAARLDALPPEEKAVLQDGAVLGKVFWSGALERLGGAPGGALGPRLHGLVRKDFIRRERRASVADQEEFAFRHVLVRDVAYGQIPRADRVDKHRLAAEWIESLSERTEDAAELLAHHYLSALEYSRAAGREVDSLGERAGVALRDAGDRALALGSFASAARYYRAALELDPGSGPARAALLLGLGRALYYGEDDRDGELASAREALLAVGERGAAAECEVLLGRLAYERAAKEAHFERALELVHGEPASRAKCSVLTTVAGFMILAGRPERALALGREALAIADELGDADLRAQNLLTTGNARLNLDDEGGLADMRLATELAESAFAISRSHGNLAGVLFARYGALGESFELVARAARASERFGVMPRGGTRFFAASRLEELYYTGRWDETVAAAEDWLAEIVRTTDIEVLVRVMLGRVLAARSDLDRAEDESLASLKIARDSRDLQFVCPAFGFRLFLLAGGGRDVESRRTADEFFEIQSGQAATWLAPGADALELAWGCVDAGRESQLLETIRRLRAANPWDNAVRLILDGDIVAAADRLDAMGDLPDAAYARLRAAQRLVEGGRRAEADVQLRLALAFYRSVDATRYVKQAELLLAAAS